MKILNIKTKQNEFFKDTEFNFDYTGNPKNNILIVGENGCGKTRLLNILYNFSTLRTCSHISNEIQIFTLEINDLEKDIIKNHIQRKFNIIYNISNRIEISINYNFNLISDKRVVINYFEEKSNTKKVLNYVHWLNEIEIYSIFSSIYSTVEINYHPKDTSNITSNEIDNDLNKSLQSGNNLADEIQQLFIDIASNDANDLSNWVNENPNTAPPENVKNKRINRFKTAFSIIFPNLNYDRIITEQGKKKVLFKKDERNIEIRELSSGEKQIVFRGAFLLKNKNSLKGYIVLIDEPEISLHPLWQEKIFNYYTALFCDEQNNQTSQIFFASHSEYVLKSALQHNDSAILILKKNINNEISAQNMEAPISLPTLTSAELNYLAFNIISNDFHTQLFTYLQSKFSKPKIKECDDYIITTTYYNSTIHSKNSTYKSTTYSSLPVYIRNSIHHPDSGNIFTLEELKTSILLLIELCK